MTFTDGTALACSSQLLVNSRGTASTSLSDCLTHAYGATQCTETKKNYNSPCVSPHPVAVSDWTFAQINQTQSPQGDELSAESFLRVCHTDLQRALRGLDRVDAWWSLPYRQHSWAQHHSPEVLIWSTSPLWCICCTCNVKEESTSSGQLLLFHVPVSFVGQTTHHIYRQPLSDWRDTSFLYVGAN